MEKQVIFMMIVKLTWVLITWYMYPSILNEESNILKQQDILSISMALKSRLNWPGWADLVRSPPAQIKASPLKRYGNESARMCERWILLLYFAVFFLFFFSYIPVSTTDFKKS